MQGLDDARTRRAAVALRDGVTGGVALPSDEGFAAACRIWNHGVRRRPAMVALCRRPEDVVLAVRTAREHGLPVSVRGGGHDWAGRALCQDGITIDLSGMRGVSVDPRAKVATIMGGARQACGGTLARLRAVKRHYDPEGMFASAIPLPTA